MATLCGSPNVRVCFAALQQIWENDITDTQFLHGFHVLPFLHDTTRTQNTHIHTRTATYIYMYVCVQTDFLYIDTQTHTAMAGVSQHGELKLSHSKTPEIFSVTNCFWRRFHSVSPCKQLLSNQNPRFQWRTQFFNSLSGRLELRVDISTRPRKQPMETQYARPLYCIPLPPSSSSTSLFCKMALELLPWHHGIVRRGRPALTPLSHKSGGLNSARRATV